MSGALGARVLLAAAAVHLGACSSNATIRRRDGVLVDARIVGSDADSLFLAGSPAGPTRLARAEVADIDHPGNVLVMAGLGVLLVGVQIIASEHQSGAELTSTAVATGLPGLAMITWGASTYLRSSGSAAPFQNETIRLTTPDPNRPYLPAPTWTSPPPPP